MFGFYDRHPRLDLAFARAVSIFFLIVLAGIVYVRVNGPFH